MEFLINSGYYVIMNKVQWLDLRNNKKLRRKTMSKFFKFFALVAISALVFIDPAMAGDIGPANANDVFNTAAGKAVDSFEGIRTIIFILGGFGLVALAFLAIFGQVRWKWFAGLALGLFVLAVAGAIVNYATDRNAGTGSTTGFQDAGSSHGV